jgi:hypothetical protein
MKTDKINNDILVNGISASDCLLLFLYISHFDKIISKYSTTNNKKEFNAIIPDKTINLVPQTNVVQHINETISNRIYCTKTRNKPVSFLTHLRNAIAHGSLVNSNGEISINDKIVRKNKTGDTIDFITAIGNYNKKSVIEILKLMLNKIDIDTEI